MFSNNPISGLLIIISLGATSPGTLLFAASTGFLGLLLSMVRIIILNFIFSLENKNYLFSAN